MKNIFFLLFILIIISCNKERLFISGNEYTIIPYNNFPNDIDSKPTKLSAKEILEIEGIISSELNNILEFHKYRMNETYGNSDKELIRKQSKFVRQYIPRLNSNNEKIITIFFICAPKPQFPRWKTQTYNIVDGGSCYFNITVNYNTKEILEFHVNSVAMLINGLINTV